MSESRPDSPPSPTRPRVLSGIRPTGAAFQLGNYLGAVRHWAAMQDEAECFFFLADLHALTEVPDPEHLRPGARAQRRQRRGRPRRARADDHDVPGPLHA